MYGQSVLRLNPEDSLYLWAEQFFYQKEPRSKIPEFDDAYGVIFRDLSGNGLADIYVVRFRNLNRLLQNRRNRSYFRERTIGSGLGGNLTPSKKSNLELGASAVDFNNDGFPEIAVAGWGKTTSLYQRYKNWKYEKLPFEYQIDGNGMAWADVNNDSYLDMLITNEHNKNKLYLNLGMGSFEDVSEEWGLTENAVSQGAAFADVNNDGWMDLYVCNWLSQDHFYLNDGKKFNRVQLQIDHLVNDNNSNSCTFSDLDNDNHLDLIVCDRDGNTCIYFNRPDSVSALPTFYKEQNCGLINPLPTYGAVTGDFDNNGYIDIYFTNIGSNRLFLNRGNHHFILAKENDHFSFGHKSYYSTGAAVADYDEDGDLDLFVANKDTICFLYTNPLQKFSMNPSIRVKLASVHSNREAIGSKIWLYEKESDKPVGYRHIQSGEGYLSAGELTAHFGVHPQKKYRVEVEFPSGIKEKKKTVHPASVITVKDEKGIIWNLHESRQLLYQKFQSPAFWKNLILTFILIFLLGFFILSGHKRYKWTLWQSIFYYAGISAGLYFIYLLYHQNGVTSVLYMQLTIGSIGMGTLMVLQERNYKTLLKRFAYRKKLLEFSQRLITIKNKNTLFEELVHTIFENLKISFCAYYDFSQMDFVVNAGPDFPPVHQELSEKARALKTGADENIFEFNITKGGKSLHTIALFFKTRGIDAGIMFIGPLMNREKIKTEDMNLLEIIANQTSISIENIDYIEESKTLVKKITENNIRKEYIQELENKNHKLNELYKNLQETQTQMIHQEKMAALGQLVAGVAHELNNPISFVYANMKELESGLKILDQLLHLINDELTQPSQLEDFKARLQVIFSEKENRLFFEELPQIIDESLEGSNRVKEIVQTLKNFSRIDESRFKTVQLHEGLDSTLLLLKNQLKDRIEVIKKYGKIPGVYCQPGQINQVFMNLLMNASQAIKGKGEIIITTSYSQNLVRIEIRDTGKGIPQENLHKIFEPFFTTRSIGKGTGLGLSITYNIIKNHNGKIWAENNPNGGAVFHIELPVNIPDKIKTNKKN